jgi:hypothetical protein
MNSRMLQLHRSTRRNKKKPTTTKSDDDSTVVSELTFAQIEGKCYCCGEPGHLSPKCPQKARPISEWAMNNSKEATFLQNALGSGDDATVGVPTPSTSSRTEEPRRCLVLEAFPENSN